jgi:hypothetical protein
MSPEIGFDPSRNYEGNPQFVDQSSEAPELAKAQLKSKVESAGRELARAKELLEESKTDELIDKEAAQLNVDLREKEFADLEGEWADQYGEEETSH